MASYLSPRALAATIFPISVPEQQKPEGTAKSTIDGEYVRIVPISEYKAAALALAEAFKEDSVSRYFIDTPDRSHWSEEQRWELHLSIMEYITYAHCMKGLVLTVGPNYGCVALWMPPGQNMDDLPTILLSGLWRLHYKLSPIGRHRFFTTFLPLLHNTKLAVLGPEDETSYYLVYVGTRPAARGMGLARKCIEHVTKRADEEGRSCYLECSGVGNLGFYGRCGFEVKEELIVDEGVIMEAMVRVPRNEGQVGEGRKEAGPMAIVEGEKVEEEAKLAEKAVPVA